MSRAALYFDNKWKDEITGFSVLKVQSIESARVIGSPVETGATSFDNKVIDPIKVVVTGVVKSTDHDTMNKISNMLYNRDFDFYSVSDGSGYYNNLILQNNPATRDVDKLDFIQYELVFIEAMLIQKQEKKPMNLENSDTRALGNQNGTKV